MAQLHDQTLNLTNNSEASQSSSPIKMHQKSRSSPKLLNNNIKALVTKSNKYLTETTAMLQKTKTVFIAPNPDSTTHLSAGGQNFEIVESLTSKNPFKLSFSPQYSFLNNIAPSFVSSMPTSNNPSFSNSSLSKFRNFAFVLSLNEKGLTKLSSDMIMNKTNLQILELKSNKLKTVPEEIFQLVNLKCLKMDCNYIKEIPVGLCDSLKQLEILSFYDNILNKIPSEISRWKQTLIYLNLAENHLDSLPNEIGQLTKLNSLHLEHNHFLYLPLSILNLGNLKELGLDWFKYAWPMLKAVQQWKSPQDEIAARFFNLKKQKLENVSFEKFVISVSLKKLDFRMVLQKERTLLHKASMDNDIGALRALLSLLYEDINKKDSDDQTPLFLAIRNENYLAAKVLLHSGADPTIGGGVLGSCLNLATAKCQYYLVSDLLKYGADVHKYDVDGNNSLHVLMCLFDSDVNSYQKIAELLLSYGLNPNALNKHKWSAIHLAIKRGQNQAVKWIMEYNESRRNENKGNEFIEFNSEGGRYETFNLNARGGDEKLTPLHLAVMQNNITLVEALVEKGKVDVFMHSKNERLASNLAIQNIFLFKILKTKERTFIQRNILDPIIKEKKLLALGKDLRLKSEAEISDDSSETRTFQKVKDLNEVTKDKRVFSQRGHTQSTNILLGSNDQRSLFFNKFSNNDNNNPAQRIFKPMKQQNTIESLNDTQISDMEENKSDLDIIFEMEGHWGKNLRSFFGSPNNIRQIDALQKVNTLLNKIRPQKNPKVQSIYSKKIATNHLKVISDNLNDLVENLKKSMKVTQVKVLDQSLSLAQRIKNLNGVILLHYKMASLLQTYHEEKTLVEQFKRLIETNPHLATLKSGEKPIFEATQQAGTFFNQTHSSLALRWLVYLLMNLNSNEQVENSVIKYYVIRLFANFYYENASSFLQSLYGDFGEPFFIRYEAFQTLKSFNKCANWLKELPKNMVASMRNSSLKPVSIEITREIGNDKLKNFGSNYFSNRKQMMRNENAFSSKNENHKQDTNSNILSQNLITLHSSEINDLKDDKNVKTLFDDIKKEQKINFNIMNFPDEEKYKIEGYREKENKEKNESNKEFSDLS